MGTTRSKAGRSLRVCVAVLAILGGSTVAGAAMSEAPPTVELPVSFDVRNVNGSKVPCLSDGKPYVVRGHLVAPPSVLSAPVRAVTLYVHPGSGGEYTWHLKEIPAYDHITQMAQLGHASVAFDIPGYDASGHPAGFQVCMGSMADIIHQVIEGLRSGRYLLNGGPGVAFSRLALAGQSSGAIMAEATAGSFGGVDALVVVSWADIPISVPVVRVALTPGSGFFVCSRGGEPVENDGSGARGYAYTWPSPSDEVQDVFYNVDPAVRAAHLKAINRDPCGLLGSIGTTIAVNNLLIGTFTFPVLVMGGDHDMDTANPTSFVIHAKRFISSDDVTLRIIPNSGHSGWIERNAPLFRATLSDWLRARGF